MPKQEITDNMLLNALKYITEQSDSLEEWVDRVCRICGEHNSSHKDEALEFAHERREVYTTVVQLIREELRRRISETKALKAATGFEITQEEIDNANLLNCQNTKKEEIK